MKKLTLLIAAVAMTTLFAQANDAQSKKVKTSKGVR